MKSFSLRYFTAFAAASIMISNTACVADESNSTKRSTPEAVCPPLHSTCKGTFGDNCYSPGDGQSCTDGLVCNRGFSACIIGKTGSCYDPGKYTCGRTKSKEKHTEDAIKFIQHERKSNGNIDYVWFYNSSWRDILVTIQLTYPSGSGSIDAVAPAHSRVPLHAGSPSNDPSYPVWSYAVTKAIFAR